MYSWNARQGIINLSAQQSHPWLLDRKPRYMDKGTMLHRHLTHQEFTLAAIDDIIDRGHRSDWEELAHAANSNPSLFDKIVRVCAAHTQDPFAQRYHFWERYVQHHRA